MQNITIVLKFTVDKLRLCFRFTHIYVSFGKKKNILFVILVHGKLTNPTEAVNRDWVDKRLERKKRLVISSDSECVTLCSCHKCVGFVTRQL